MSTALNHTQRATREAFKNVILNEGGIYPDDVRIVPLEGMTVERMADLMQHHVVEGTALVLVRSDGCEFLMEKHEREFVGKVIDRALHRVRVRLTALACTTAANVAAEERYVHPNNVGDLRELNGHLVTC